MVQIKISPALKRQSGNTEGEIFSLRAEGLLSIVCPVRSEGNVCGIGIFNSSFEDTKKIMDDDPGVKQGIFVYEVYTCRSFPGDCLPE